MNETVKYLKIVAELLNLYQRELIRLFKKYPQELPHDFNKVFATTLIRLKEAEINKAIDDALSPHCQRMAEYLKGPTPHQSHQVRLNKTSVQPRRNLQSQAGTRVMGLTGGLKRYQQQKEAIEQESQLNDIIQSYKIQEEIMPRMRMKWKSNYEAGHSSVEEKQISTIGNNNIHLLSYAIPEIENSIRRLSFQRSPKSTKEREFQIYRTLQSRSAKKKYIPRLF